MSAAGAKVTVINQKKSQTSAQDVRELASNELIFAVVGPVGAGPSMISAILDGELKREGFEVQPVKATSVLKSFAQQKHIALPFATTTATRRDGTPKRNLALTSEMQNLGDRFRGDSGDNAAIARELVKLIRVKRAESIGVPLEGAIQPDGKPRAFILDSIRHPAEVSLLRRVYQDAFCLIGIVCHEKVREERLLDKYDATTNAIHEFMERDENAPELNGQKVADAFHLADFFIDNSNAARVRLQGNDERNRDWDVDENVGRLLNILLHKQVERPRLHELGMFHAYGARMRSSCLSRQVGAALIGKNGDLIATGTNEVPIAGGGTYAPHLTSGAEADPNHDHRCFVHNKYCSNTKEQNKIIDSLFKDVPALSAIAYSEALRDEIRKTRIGQLIEFSRAVHAEMDALLAAARSAVSPLKSRLYVTTFPCHNCARHIIAAGVIEVQYIEPYFKSQAMELHGDAITDDPHKALANDTEERVNGLQKDGNAPARKKESGKVLFHPFVGVAPRLYRRAFYKDRMLKDENSGEMSPVIGPPDGPSTTEVLRISYSQLEAHLADDSGKQA